MTKTVVVLGAGVAGIPVIHHLLRFTAPKVKDLKVILVAPNTEAYWSLASVRGLVPGQFSDEQLFAPIAPTLSQYSSDKFEFIVGKAESLNSSANSVVVKTTNGQERTLDYHTLVIATGTTYNSGLPFNHLNSTEETKAALQSLRDRVKAAKSIVVAGAGVTGIETIGELGSEYGKNGAKQLTLLSSEKLPLRGNVMDSVRQAAKNEMEKLKIKIVPEATVTNVSEAGPGGETILEVTTAGGKKETINTDLYIPTFGSTPNTSFLPAEFLDDKGYVKQDKYLRAGGVKNVFVVGDAGNLQNSQAIVADNQVKHLVKDLQHILAGTGDATEFKYDNSVMLGITVGRDRGTGQFGKFKPFSLIIWYVKGRYLGTDFFKDFAAGNRTISGKWKE